MEAGNRRVVLAALMANMGIAIAKFVAWAFTGSAAMLAEAVHSVADTGNQALLFLGGRRAQKPPSREHPFGYGRERYFWAFVVALILFSMGSLFALYEGYHRLVDPHPITSPAWAIAVLTIGIGLEGFALRTAVRAAEQERGELGWWQFIRRARSPEIPVVLLEDVGAVIGLVVALVGVALTTFTGDARFDAMGSLAIGLLLGVIAIVLAREMKSLLIGEGARDAHIDHIRSTIRADREIVAIHDLRTLHLGPERLLVVARLELDAELGFGAVSAALDRVEAALRQTLPLVSDVYLEPQTAAALRSRIEPAGLDPD